MRHVVDSDLDRLEPLLTRLRAVESLRERKRGNFQYRSKAFLHFHADGDDLYADVRLDGVSFERLRVATPVEHAELLDAVARALGCL